jgi:hypothetical protein
MELQEPYQGKLYIISSAMQNGISSSIIAADTCYLVNSKRVGLVDKIDQSFVSPKSLGGYHPHRAWVTPRLSGETILF